MWPPQAEFVPSIHASVTSSSPNPGSAFGAALPTVSVAAVAGVHPAMIDPMVIANAASNRPRHRILTMVLPHLLSGVAFTASISAFWANAGAMSTATKAIASAILRMSHGSL
jgi:hypothetical protein